MLLLWSNPNRPPRRVNDVDVLVGNVFNDGLEQKNRIQIKKKKVLLLFGNMQKNK